MDIINIIKKRRSIRQYQDKVIPRKALERIVDAARFAATARNIQPWEFVMVTKIDILKKIADITEHGKFIAQAKACLVVFSADTKYYLEDGSAAIENAMLEAASLGVGSCWVAGDKKPYVVRINALLAVPQQYKLVGLVSLGYPANKKDFHVAVKRELSQLLHWEMF